MDKTKGIPKGMFRPNPAVHRNVIGVAVWESVSYATCVTCWEPLLISWLKGEGGTVCCYVCGYGNGAKIGNGTEPLCHPQHRQMVLLQVLCGCSSYFGNLSYCGSVVLILTIFIYWV